MILYLHGFNSSPQSTKAQYLKRYLEERGRGGEYRCPRLPNRPNLAVAAVEEEIARFSREEITLLGSSLGGFYATWLAERHALRAVLINPAIDPHVGLRPYLGLQQPVYGGEAYELTVEHLQEWRGLFVTRIHPERYLLLVETGDEVLDYRLAVRRYLGAKQIVIQGGDHSCASFPEHLPLILSFAGMA
ncbi:MAG TPA: YqiA/YcfP family alpha/beta fold hydrolase [Burkholderiales bacterium]|nr:YqiA/YcfP family alpha/beta fold hydrolase [Burkholderiales bacterium]